MSRVLRRANAALGWAIGALATGLLALAVGIGALVYAIVNTPAPPISDTPVIDEGAPTQGWQSGYPAWGSLGAFAVGNDVTGEQMSKAATEALESAGASVDTITCPTAKAVDVSAVVACEGAYDGIDDWSLIIYVVDQKGSILVTSY